MYRRLSVLELVLCYSTLAIGHLLQGLKGHDGGVQVEQSMTPCVWTDGHVVSYCAEIRKAVPNPSLHSPTTATAALQGSTVDMQGEVPATVLPKKRTFNGEGPTSLQNAMTTPPPRLSSLDDTAVECEAAPVHGRRGRYQGSCRLRDTVMTGEKLPDLPPLDAMNTQYPTFSFPDDATEDCRDCTIFFNSLSVFYPPAESSNTDCLPDFATLSSTPIPSDLNPRPGSAYVIVRALSAGNPCTAIAAYTSQTFTFGPRELSTVRGADQLVTSEFNFADLPCPPESLTRGYEQMYRIYAPNTNSSKTYAPFIAPFPQIYDLDARFRYCTVARYEGVYPASKLKPAKGPTTADKGVRFGPKRFGPNRGKDEDDDDEKDKRDKKEEEKKNKEEEKKDEEEKDKDKRDKQEDGDGGRRPDRSRRHHLIKSPENAHFVPRAPKETDSNVHRLRPFGK